MTPPGDMTNHKPFATKSASEDFSQLDLNLQKYNDLQEINTTLIYPNSVLSPTQESNATPISSNSVIKSNLKLNSNPHSFLSTWDTTLNSSDSNEITQISLPLQESGSYNFNIDWGDGTNDTITSYNSTSTVHNYVSSGIPVPGFYIINITGELIGWSFQGSGDAQKIIQIYQWGDLQLGNTGFYFAGASNLDLTAIDPLNLTGTRTLQGIFENCTSLRDTGDLNSWNTADITNMAGMFSGATNFNQPLDNWDVSNVKNMSSMFSNAWIFNQSLNNWDVSSVQDMSWMFFNLKDFNQPLDNWNVSNVQDMSGMFSQSQIFNQSLNSWVVSNVRDMSRMFENTGAFNQNLSAWNISNVQDMHAMFNHALLFNQPLGSWNVSNVQVMDNMFSGDSLSTINYDQLLIGWSRLSLSQSVNFNAGYSRYSSDGLIAKNYIISTFNWTISDDGFAYITTPTSISYISISNSSFTSTPTSAISHANNMDFTKALFMTLSVLLLFLFSLFIIEIFSFRKR